MGTRDQGPSLIFDPGLLNFNNIRFLLKSHWANCNVTKFHIKPLGIGGTKICLHGLGYMISMATTPI